VHPYVKSTFCQNIFQYILNDGLDMVMIIFIGILLSTQANGKSKKLEEVSPVSFPKGDKMLKFYIICFKQVRGSYVKQHFSSHPIIT
jgi:hypothetical protein